MLGLLLISMVVVLTIVALVAVVVFLRAAFWGEEDMASESKAVLTWRPPFLHGVELRNWAATTTADLVGGRLQGDRSDVASVRLANEIGDVSVRAMLPLAAHAELELEVVCPESGQGRIGLTAPE